MKNGFFVARRLVAILLLGVTVVGCTTTQHGIEISNVPRDTISAVYIRNAGTADWGTNIAANLSNINRTRYSQTVDIRVVDTGGVVYSRYDVSFDDAAFVETGETSTINLFAATGLLGAVLLALWLIPRGEGGEE